MTFWDQFKSKYFQLTISKITYDFSLQSLIIYYIDGKVDFYKLFIIETF